MRENDDTIPIIPILYDADLEVLDLLYSCDVIDTIIHYDTLANYQELKKYLDTKAGEYQSKDKYIIDYFANHGIIIIEITGPLKQENFSGLKLAFKDFLKTKMNHPQGIIYIFNNVDEKTVHFSTIWPLFQFWQTIGIDLDNIYFLSSDSQIAREIKKCYGANGLMQFKDIFEAVKMLIPEYSRKDDSSILDFSAELLKSSENSSL
ncbi:MAG: hypothetical protein MJB14_13080 [Spirochaetes bacterium]|nr:hypothetical protein [Spirochaetota bacterium]